MLVPPNGPHREKIAFQWEFSSKSRQILGVFGRILLDFDFFSKVLGYPMYVIPDDVIYDPPLLCQFIQKHQITRMLFTPSLLEAVIDTQKDSYLQESLKSLR